MPRQQIVYFCEPLRQHEINLTCLRVLLVPFDAVRLCHFRTVATLILPELILEAGVVSPLQKGR